MVSAIDRFEKDGRLELPHYLRACLKRMEDSAASLLSAKEEGAEPAETVRTTEAS